MPTSPPDEIPQVSIPEATTGSRSPTLEVPVAQSESRRTTLPPTPDLLLLTNLLARLLEKLEEPSGEFDIALAQVLTQISSLADTMAKAAQAFETTLGPEGALGRIEAELAILRTGQAAQWDRIEALAGETATLVDWLGAPPGEPPGMSGGETA